MAVIPVGFVGLGLILVRLVLWKSTARYEAYTRYERYMTDHPFWVDQGLRAEWWFLQPVLWAASIKQVTGMARDAIRLQNRTAAAEAENLLLRQQHRIKDFKMVATGVVGGAGLSATGIVAWLLRQPGSRPHPAPEPPLPPPTPLPAPPAQSWKDRVLRRDTAFIVGNSLASGMFVLTVARVVLGPLRQPFRDSMHQECTPNIIRRIVTIQCPGVLRGNVVIKVHPNINGAEVDLKRCRTRGVPSASWKKTYEFPWTEGTYACRQEALVLENGVLTLVFEAQVGQQRVLRVAPPEPTLAYNLAISDMPMLTGPDGLEAGFGAAFVETCGGESFVSFLPAGAGAGDPITPNPLPMLDEDSSGCEQRH